MRASDGVAAALDALRARPLLALLAASAALKLLYVFLLTGYPSYLFSDFAGYWDRAHERLDGDPLAYRQWAYWPPLPHILLAGYLSLVRAVGLGAHELAAALSLNVAASTGCVALVYGIALETLKARRWALGVAALYAFTFPLVYFNAFVMSEHGATLFMLAALWLLLKFRSQRWALLAAGGMLGLAAGMRPGFGLFGLPAALYLAFVDGRWSRRTLLDAAVFSGGFFLVVGCAVLEVQRISSGRVSGLSANGPLAFYLGQCRTATVRITYQGQSYVFAAPSYVSRPENGAAEFVLASYDRQVFRDLGWRCLREEPHRLRTALEHGSDLFFGPLLPTVPDAAGAAVLLPVFRGFFFACALLLPLGFAVRPVHGVSIPVLRLMGGLLVAATGILALFSTEHRYLYPLLALIYVPVAAILLAATRDPRRFAKALLLWMAALAIAAIAAGAMEAERWSGPAAIRTLIRRFPSPYIVNAQSQQLSESTGQRLRGDGERLWRREGADEVAFAVHSTCMEVLQPGVYELQVVAPVGFALFLDGRLLMETRSARRGDAYVWRTPIAAGRHLYELRMDGPVAATATWRRMGPRSDDFAPALGMRYIGEPGRDAVFLPPGRC